MNLNLPSYNFKTRKNETGITEVFDPLRKKYVVTTPEEWVRLRFIQFLINEKKYPESLISIEKGLTVNRMKKRFDAVVHDKKGLPAVLIEFKSPEVKIDQKVFDQIAAYNIQLKVDYLIVSNGLKHYCCRINSGSGQWEFLKSIPTFNELYIER